MFNVLVHDFNQNKFVPYNVIPYLVNCYKEAKKKPKTFKEFRKFIDKESKYQFWSRCQYEVILMDWPCQKLQEKIDVYEQIKMNLDVVTKILMEAV